jgi:hypothetical protein
MIGNFPNYFLYLISLISVHQEVEALYNEKLVKISRFMVLF